MSLHILKKPLRMVPALPQRAPQANIPQTLDEREQLRTIVVRYVDEHRDTLVPPLVLDELKIHADALVAQIGLDPVYRDYVGVLINNEVWTDHLATVPFDRRLLLLPKCLRVEDKCPAPFDEFGLLCKQCGLCTIQDLQEEAERLGYAVLVAEGSALVMALIQSGKVDAIVGVSCLSVLERAFPYMEAAAVPGVAIPLLQDDCRDTGVDIDWVWNVVHLTSDDHTRRLDLDALRSEVETWFAPAALEHLLGPAEGDADRIARAWLSAEGKRWRPFLTACVYKALQDDPTQPLPDTLRRAAVAVECFHKASLVHDDIEDQDEHRYGRETLHAEHGVAVALNAGDLLIGEGYRLLAECGAPPQVCAALVRVAAAGHRELCIGQGTELSWMRHPAVLTADQALETFRRKTSPAFQVALSVGRDPGGRDGGDTGRAAAVQRRARRGLSDPRRPRGPRRDRRRGGGLHGAVARARAGVRSGEGVRRRRGDGAVARRPDERRRAPAVQGARRRARRRGSRARTPRRVQRRGDPQPARAAERQSEGAPATGRRQSVPRRYQGLVQ